jgi:hypothetical protein
LIKPPTDHEPHRAPSHPKALKDFENVIARYTIKGGCAAKAV